MSPIAIITDSDSSLPADLAAQYGIRQVPITVHFGAESFETGIDIDDAKLFARVTQEGKLPTTSAPAPGSFVKAFQAAIDEGAKEIVCICVSSEISATYTAAVTASKQFPGCDIEVIDSRTLSMAQGLMALEAAQAAREGASKAEIIARARDIGKRSVLFGAVATLKYLALSGRVGNLAATMGNILQVKPILTVEDGKLKPLDKVRTQKKAWARLIELATEALGGGKIERMAIVHTNVYEQARAFEAQARAALPCPDEIIIADFTAGLSVHTGEGLMALVVVTGADK